MKIIIAGSSGLVGTALVSFLTEKGHDVQRLVRKNPKGNDIKWDPDALQVDRAPFERADIVINLAGDNVASGYWTQFKKKRILDSRVNTTKTIAQCLMNLNHPPKLWINASATGFYGSRGDEILTEQSTNGSGFLAKVCREWEAAAQPAINAGVNVAFLRTGVVLSSEGGALGKMLTPFKLGLGGKIGSGKQYMSWISIHDMVSIIAFIMEKGLTGPINIVSPGPVTNEQFTKVLGKVLHRPTFLAMPEFAARFVLGEMADEMLLASQRVEPKKLQAAGYSFIDTNLESTLQKLIG